MLTEPATPDRATCPACGWASHEPTGSPEEARSLEVHTNHFCKYRHYGEPPTDPALDNICEACE